jgi:hypothetical protein
MSYECARPYAMAFLMQSSALKHSFILSLPDVAPATRFAPHAQTLNVLARAASRVLCGFRNTCEIPKRQHAQ